MESNANAFANAETGGQSNVRGRLLQFDPACLRWSWGEGRARATPCQCLSSHSGYWRHQKYLVVQIISTIKGALYLTLPGDPSIQSRPYTYSTTVPHPDVQRWCSKINLQPPGWSQSGPAVLGGSPGQSCQVINILFFLIIFAKVARIQTSLAMARSQQVIFYSGLTLNFLWLVPLWLVAFCLSTLDLISDSKPNLNAGRS